MLAALNHPHVAAICRIEESDGIHALVLELVEGETLAERLERSKDRSLQRSGSGGASAPPIPIAEALTIARQIADALDAPHEKGIIHRDLKPANIKITPDGTVKMLNFGLPKAVVVGDGSPHAAIGDPSPSLAVADGDDRWDAGGPASRNGGVHEPGTGARESGRQADRHRLGALKK